MKYPSQNAKPPASKTGFVTYLNVHHFLQEIQRLKDLKRKEGLVKDPILKVRKKKKAKGPNPLAMKKRKSDKKRQL